jgi:hypothetical protein
MEYIFPSTPLDKRLKVSLDYNHKIQFYGADNLYPQRAEQVRLRSPLLVSATRIFEDFINGEGWDLNNDIILNHHGQTGRDVLNLAAKDFSRSLGFALHLNFDGRGLVTEIQHIPFEYCRLGLPDAFGNVSTIVVSNNWEEDSEKLPPSKNRSIYTETFPIFNPLTAGGETVTIPQPLGQVLYFTGIEKNKYPLASFDAIWKTGETDDSIQSYENSNTKKGFHGATIFRYPGTFESETQKAQMVSDVSKMMGPDGPGITIAQIDEDFSGALMESIPATSNDTLFDLTLNSLINRTLYHYNIPPALFGIAPSGGVFTQLAYQESFIVYNVINRNVRSLISRVFNKVANVWHQEPFTFGEIKENVFEVKETENQKVRNRYTGPTDAQINATAGDVAAEQNVKKAENSLKTIKNEDI